MSKFGASAFNGMHTVSDPKCYAGRTQACTQITILIYSTTIDFIATCIAWAMGTGDE